MHPLRITSGLLIFLLVPAGAWQAPRDSLPPFETNADGNRLPNGKSRTEEILKADERRSLTDAKELLSLATALEKDLEQEGAQDLLSITDIHRTEEIEKLSKRIRSRIRRN